MTRLVAGSVAHSEWEGMAQSERRSCWEFVAFTEIVKCVMHEHEYMMTKDDVGDAYMRVEIVPPVGGQCVQSSTVNYSRQDTTYDLKHQVAILDTDTSLAGKCVNVDIIRSTIASNGSSTVNVFCYYAAEKDYEY